MESQVLDIALEGVIEGGDAGGGEKRGGEKYVCSGDV